MAAPIELPDIPVTSSVLASYLTGYKAPAQKILEMEKCGEIVRLKRGLFVKSASRYNFNLLANHIYGPSYVSRESALWQYGLIPEFVYTTTSVCINRSRIFENKLGRFSYDILPLEYYRMDIVMHEDGGVCCLIASPEKALADLVVLSSGVRLRYMGETKSYLEDYLRIDMDEFMKLNPDRFVEYADAGKKPHSLLNLAKLLRQ